MKAQELKELMRSGQPVHILDVREQGEYEAGEKMEGAKNVPMGQVFVEAAQGKLPKDQKIITVCKSGMRCEIVARELKQKGYDIDYLEGGLQTMQK